MSAEVISIHNISNEMVAKAPPVSQVIQEIHHFMSEGVPVAHHSPFDMGFLSIEFERAGLPALTTPVLCSSLLSRRAFPQCPNHKLQTLIQYFKLNGGQAHRALDDARACLQLSIKCFEKLGLRVKGNDC